MTNAQEEFINNAYFLYSMEKESIEKFVDLIIKLNKEIIDFSGGHHGAPIKANIYFAIYCASKPIKKNDKESISKSAAILFYHLAAKAHGFTDGNKRTAYIMSVVWCFLYGYSLNLKYSGATVEFVLKVAKNELKLKEIQNEFKANMTKIEGSLNQDIETFINNLKHFIKHDEKK